MINRAGQWTQTPSATLLQPKKWNAHFWITFNFWWSAGLVDGLKSHLPPLSSQKNEMFVFGLCSTSDDRPGWSMDSNPIRHPSPAKKMKCSFLDYFQFLEISQAGQWTQTPSTTPLQPKNEMLIFGLHSTSDDWSGWSMDSNPICHSSSTKKMICSFLEHAQLLMIGQAGQWTRTPSATPLQPKKWNANFWITFNFWWLAGLVIELESHPPPVSSQKKWNAHFWITFNFWWSARLVNGLEPHPLPLSSQKNEMLVFGLCSTSDDWPGCTKDSNPICHPSPAKKMKCLFLYYGQLLMISRACWWTWIPSATPLQPKKWSAHFWIMFNFWWLAGLVNGLKPHLPSLSKQKNDMLIFVLHSSSDHWLGWSMDSNPICNLSPAKKVKCSFLDYVQLLMIGGAGQWTQTPSATSLQA